MVQGLPLSWPSPVNHSVIRQLWGEKKKTKIGKYLSTDLFNYEQLMLMTGLWQRSIQFQWAKPGESASPAVTGQQTCPLDRVRGER